MQLVVRTLSGKKFEIEIDENASIVELKQKIEDASDISSDDQTLIYAGKFMEDDKTVKDYNITSFVVLKTKKVTRSRPARQQRTQRSTTQPSTQPEQPTQPSGQPQSSAETTTTTSTTDSTPVQNENNDENLVTGPEYDAMVDSISSMGFPKDEVHRALRLAFNNPHRAVEYLTSGFPEENEEGNEEMDVEEHDSNESGEEEDEGDINSLFGGQIPPEIERIFQQLREMHELTHLRYIVQNNPERMEEVLGIIQRAFPQLMPLVQQFPEVFLRFMNEPIPPEVIQNLPQLLKQQREMTLEQRLTEEDKATIDNIVEMTGKNRMIVVERYLLFDKNGQMTANYFLQNPDDDEDEM